MNLSEYSQNIESLNFSVHYGLTNSLEILYLAWTDDASIQAIIQILRENPEESAFILERLQLLAKTAFEAGSWHPQDMAITAYLYSLEQSAQNDALSQAQKLVMETKGLYWARKLAEKISHENLPQKP